MLGIVWVVRLVRIGVEVVVVTAALFALLVVALWFLGPVGDGQEMIVILAVLCLLQALHVVAWLEDRWDARGSVRKDGSW